MNISSLLSYLGTALEALGVLSLVPVIAAVLSGEHVYIPFFIPAFISFAAGLFLDRKFQKEGLDLGSVMALSVLCLLAASAAGAIPFLFYMPASHAVFESVSGFTTTGLTAVNPETLPRSLVFWRSFTQWLGGAGILLAFILLAASPGISSYHLYGPEAKRHRIDAAVYASVKRVWKIYGAVTVIGIFLLFMAGLPVFDSVVHSMSGISTGGFSSRNSSVAAFGNGAVSTIMAGLMIIGATSFFLHEKASFGEVKAYLKSPETTLFLGLLAAFGILLSFSFSSVSGALFQVVSALTTSGFSAAAINGEFPKLLLAGLMIAGGFAGSSAGGIKLIRLGIICRAVPWVERKMLLPASAVLPFRFGGRVMDEHEVAIVSVFVCLYALMLGISTLALSSMGYAPIDSFFQSASAAGNAGLSVIPAAAMPLAGRAVLMTCMIMGRLEIFPLVVLIGSVIRMKKS